MNLLRLGIGQTRPQIGDAEYNQEQILEILKKAKDARVDVLVLPELTNSGYAFKSMEEAAEHAEEIPDGPLTDMLIKWSRERAVVAGVCEQSKDELYNSAVVVANGQHVLTYRKIHLFNREKEIFRPGMEEPPVFEFKRFRFGVMVCWDWIFPETARILALKGAQVILHPANLVLPYCNDAMVTRAIENGVFTATANRVGEERELSFYGRSQVVSNKGKRLLQLSSDEVELGWVDIDPCVADNKMMTERNHILHDRRPELYRRLTRE